MNLSSSRIFGFLSFLALLSNACSQNSESGGGGTTGTDGGGGTSTGAGGMGGAPNSGGNCSWEANGGGDPTAWYLSCDDVSDFYSPKGGLPSAGELQLSFAWCGCGDWLCYDVGDPSDLNLSVPAQFGTVLSSTTDCQSDEDSGFSTTIALAEGATSADVELTSTASGVDQCHQPLSCPLVHRFHVVLQEGTVQITQLAESP